DLPLLVQPFGELGTSQLGDDPLGVVRGERRSPRNGCEVAVDAHQRWCTHGEQQVGGVSVPELLDVLLHRCDRRFGHRPFPLVTTMRRSLTLVPPALNVDWRFGDRAPVDSSVMQYDTSLYP